VRSTNLLERSLGEVRRRTNVIVVPRRDQLPHPYGPSSTFVITNETNGIRFTQLDRQHLNRIRYQDLEQTLAEEVNAA
jgi:hypothetical protein